MCTEFGSAYLYLQMQTWFEKNSLNGFSNWYAVQVQEERDHAQKIRAYILHVGGSPEFFAIAAPDASCKSVADILNRTLEHEQMVTKKITEIMDAAQTEHDYKTIQFLQWYIDEQCEEEDNVSNLIARLNMANQSEAGILYMDSELSSRTYTPPQDNA